MGLIFNKRRPDGQLVKGGDPMMHIMPYVMRGRNESAIYYRDTVDIGNMQRYIREKRREGQRITLFNIIITAMLHLIYERPHLNRFIAGRRLYSHNSFDILYAVKTSLTDEAAESIARVTFDENDNLFSICDEMTAIINKIKEGSSSKWDDKLIAACAGMPRWFLRAFANSLRWADFHGYLPSKWLELIPLYSSIFVSHLGSIGGGSPFHHLYEFGTTSIFVTIGKVYEKPYKTLDGGLEWRRVVDLCFTIDERICDGFYLIKSLKHFDNILQTPELLELSPAQLKTMSDKEINAIKKRSLSKLNGDETPLRTEEISDKHEFFEDNEDKPDLRNAPY